MLGGCSFFFYDSIITLIMFFFFFPEKSAVRLSEVTRNSFTIYADRRGMIIKCFPPSMSSLHHEEKL